MTKVSRTSRRRFLKQGTTGALALATLGPNVVGCSDDGTPVPVPAPGDLTRHGPLLPANDAGLMLPEGFTGRIIAESMQPVGNTDFTWPLHPDGGATYAAGGGDWIYVANSEFPIFQGRAGVSAIRFDRRGRIVDAYSILTGSTWNCSGGKTPWGTWLSGEEWDPGIVWECDPLGQQQAVERRALGVFAHEAVAVDPINKRLYLTEDEGDGRFYRFTADAMHDDGWPDLSSGTLEAMHVTSGDRGAVTWAAIPDPSAATTPTREQLPTTTTGFDGGEGVWYHDGKVYFTTKGDNRIWVHDIAAETVDVVYDIADYTDPILTGVDFILVTEGGDMVVGEDGGDMQVVAVSAAGDVVPLAQVVDHPGSEITGIAFDPSLRRMIFSSQRGDVGMGFTYMVEGPFFGPLG